DEVPQLSKGPIAVSRSLSWPSSPHPRTDMPQVFQRNPAICAFSLGNEPLTDNVVAILLKAALATFELTQAPFRRPRSYLLERLATLGVPLAAMLNPFTTERLAVAVGCQIDDIQVNPKHPLNVERIGFVHLTAGEQVELSTHG